MNAVFAKAKAAIYAVHGDTSVSAEVTLDRLEDLAKELGSLIFVLKEEIENAEDK